MNVQIKRIILLLGIIYLPIQTSSSQHSSKNNYTGAWETPTTWSPTWAVPQTNLTGGGDIAINGYITVNGSLSFDVLPSNLIINDTLVINGDLYLGSFNNLTVNGSGILILRGNLTLDKNSTIITNNYIIITGYIWKLGSNNSGSFVSNTNPAKVFIGGYIYPAALSNKPNFPALNCTAPTTTPYPNSGCSYGNMTDIINDPIYPFFQSTCTTATPTITAGGPTTFCAGGSVTLTSSAGTSYLWSNGATTQNINASTSGSYTVKVINASGCQSAESVATVVTSNALPVTPIISASGPITFCIGGTVTLTSSAGTNYLWSNGATTPSINITSPGSYTIQVIDAKGCKSALSAATAINVISLPVVDAGTDTTIPNGTSTIINATVTGTGPFTYSWSPSAQLVNASIEDPTTVNLASTKVFTLNATSLTTSCSNTDAVMITISGGALNSTPTATPGTICAGANIQLHALASGGSGSYTYAWSSTPVGFISSIGDPIANPMFNTTYYIAVSDGFNTVNQQVTVYVNTVPATPTITASGPTTFCAGGNVNLTSSTGTSYIWSNGAITSVINVNTSGIYTVLVTNASGCQSAPSAISVVTVNALPATPTIIASGSTTFCEGDAVTLTSSAGTNYLWSNAATTASINVAAAGSYTVKITNASGCQSPISVGTIVTVNALPATPTIVSSGPPTFCDGESVTLTSSYGRSYLWSNAETSASINVTSAGSYTVQVRNSNGCQSAVSTAATIAINALPIVAASNNGPVCEGTALNLTASPAGIPNYSWTGPGGFSSLLQNPSVSANATLAMAGSYTLTVIDVNGCVNKATQSIIVDETPIAVAGPDLELQFNFDTQMNAELSASETGEWSLITGSGKISDLHSPTTRVTELSIGENIFLWKVLKGSCEDTSEVEITVHDLFVPSVITPNGDGKNDYFKLSNYTGKVDLIIINRWGNEEYTSDNYLNDWDGRNNKGKELPADTYFYILKLENGKIQKGSVLIKR